MSAELVLVSMGQQSGLKVEACGSGLYITAWKTVNDDSETVDVQLGSEEVAALAAFAAAFSRQGGAA